MYTQNLPQRLIWLGVILGIGAIGLVSVILSQIFSAGASSLYRGTPPEPFEQGPKATRNARERATLRAISTVDPFLLTPFNKRTLIHPTPVLIRAKFLQRIAGNGRIIEGINFTHFKNTLGIMSTNMWIEKTKDKYIVVYAGEQMNLDEGYKSENQGALIVEWRPLDKPSLFPGGKIRGSGGVFLTPKKAGVVFIENAVGERLVIRATDGSIFVFDVATQQFVTQNAFDPNQRQVGGGTLLESGEAPLAQAGLKFWHSWHPAAGRMSLFTGAQNYVDNDLSSGEGIIVISENDSYPNQPRILPAPQAKGFLRIFDIVGTHAILIGNLGGTLVFDLTAQQFLDPSKVDDLPFAPLFDN